MLLIYTERVARFGTAEVAAAQRSRSVANLRLAAFLAGVAAVSWGWWQAQPPVVWLGVALGAAFLILIVVHARLEAARRRLELLTRFNREGLARRERDWDALPLRHAARASRADANAADLDLFGRGSLLHLLDTPATAAGEATLTRWLLCVEAPPTAEVIRERQAAVAELAPRIDDRDELRVRGAVAEGNRPDPAGFLQWAEWTGPPPPPRWLAWLTRLTPPLLIATGLADLFGIWPNRLWLLPLIANLGLALWLVPAAQRQLNAAISRERYFRAYADVFGWTGRQQFGAGALRRVQAELAGRAGSAEAHLRHLDGLAGLAIAPSALYYLPWQVLTLWDVHLLDRFDAWRRLHGFEVRGWLAALGELEALAALATLAHDQPAWTLPTVEPTEVSVTARALGHPLLTDDERVANDVTVGPPGTFLLVTGSNMSGKSTLLRAIGLNAVLAMAGGPVCAEALTLPPLRVWTSMRVSDSLTQGVSFFMAELHRLKAVVGAAAPADTGADGAPLLYLLDEILQGTNTHERQVAVRRILRYLLTQPALGAISTHDLQLADTPGLAESAQRVHFTERVSAAEAPAGEDAGQSGGEGEQRSDASPLSFDYRLRPGLARTTNALRLMDLLRFPGGDDPEPERL